jgi:hypothetical protein
MPVLPPTPPSHLPGLDQQQQQQQPTYQGAFVKAAQRQQQQRRQRGRGQRGGGGGYIYGGKQPGHQRGGNPSPPACLSVGKFSRVSASQRNFTGKGAMIRLVSA